MSNFQNTRIIELLHQLWLANPHERFGQLLFNHTRFGSGHKDGKIDDIFNYKDNDIEGDLRNAIGETNNRKS